MGFSLGYVLLAIMIPIVAIIVFGPLIYVAATRLRERIQAWALAFIPFMLVIMLAVNCMMIIDRDESLVMAAGQGEVDEVRRLLKSGADPNASFDGIEWALEAAARQGHMKVAELLIQEGATDNSILGEGKTISNILVEKGRKDLARKIGWTEANTP